MKYQVVAGQETLDFLFACNQRDRQLLAKLFQELALDPCQTGEYEEADDTGRPLQVRLVGNFLVTFWTDHPVKEVRVVRVEKAP